MATVDSSPASAATPQPPWLQDLLQQSQQRNWRESETGRALLSSYSALLFEAQTAREDKELLAGQVHQLREQLRLGHTTGDEYSRVVQQLAVLQLENTQLHAEVDQWRQREQAYQDTQQQLTEVDAALGIAKAETTAASDAYAQLRTVYTQREQETNLIKMHFELQRESLEHAEVRLAEALTQIETLSRELRRVKKRQGAV